MKEEWRNVKLPDKEIKTGTIVKESNDEKKTRKDFNFIMDKFPVQLEDIYDSSRLDLT